MIVSKGATYLSLLELSARQEVDLLKISSEVKVPYGDLHFQLLRLLNPPPKPDP